MFAGFPLGGTIKTFHQMEIMRLLKAGDKKSVGDFVTVELMGGRVKFDDGTSAEIRTPGFRRMENGKTYVLFLMENDREPGALALVGGPQGLFEIPVDGGTLQSHGKPINTVAKQAQNKDVKTFLNEVRKAAEKGPEYVPCCGN